MHDDEIAIYVDHIIRPCVQEYYDTNRNYPSIEIWYMDSNKGHYIISKALKRYFVPHTKKGRRIYI